MNLNTIWNFYKTKYKRTKKKIPKNIMKIKTKNSRAKKIIANKFCSCVKKLEHKYGAKGIGICTSSVFTKKGLKRTGTFSCKPSKVTFTRIRKK